MPRLYCPVLRCITLPYLKKHADSAAGSDPTAKLQTAAPDIQQEETFFRPRSQAQENANIGADEGKPASAPTGPWVDAAKELVPPLPAPEVNAMQLQQESG